MQKIDYLHGLRGVAAIIVFFSHFGLSYYPGVTIGWERLAHSGWEKYVYATLPSIIYSGGFAVYIFLILSGFLAIYQYQRSSLTIRSWLRFVTGRWIRIFAPALVSVLIAWLLVYVGSSANLSAAAITGSNWINRFPIEPNLWLAINEMLQASIRKLVVTYNLSLWPLAFFFLGPIIVQGIAALIPRIPWRFFVMSLGFILLYSTDFDVVLLGAMVGLVYPELKKFRLNDPTRGKLGLGMIFFAIALGAIPTIRGDLNSNYLLWTLLPLPWDEAIHFYYTTGSVLLLLGLMISPQSQKLFFHPILQRLGSLSYAIFIIHFLVITIFSPLIFLALHSQVPYDIAVGITFITTSGMLIFISQAFNKNVEKPFNTLSKWISGTQQNRA